MSVPLRMGTVSKWLTVLADWLTSPPQNSQIGPRLYRNATGFSWREQNYFDSVVGRKPFYTTKGRLATLYDTFAQVPSAQVARAEARATKPLPQLRRNAFISCVNSSGICSGMKWPVGMALPCAST